MPYQDYYRIFLDQSIWDRNERNLRPGVRSQVMDQVGKRFPQAQHVYVVGALTTNFWEEDSDLDLLVAVPKNQIYQLAQELPIINGREIITRYSPIPDSIDQKTPISKNHPVYWYLVSDTVSPNILAERFGRVYDIINRTWFGHSLPGKAQLGNPQSILQYINWKLFKYKETTELYPILWTFIFSSFPDLTEREQLDVIDQLKWRANKLDRMIQKKLTKYDASAWKALEAFENELIETEDEELAPATLSAGTLPDDLVYLVLHKWRYRDIADRLEEKAETEAKQRYMEELMQPLPLNIASVRTAVEGLSNHLLRRFNDLFTVMISGSGGSSNATETITELFIFLLENNRFVRTDLIRRKIATALYRRYILGR